MLMKYFIATVACLALLIAVAAFFRAAPAADAFKAAQAARARPAIAGVIGSCFPNGVSDIDKSFNAKNGVAPTITSAQNPPRCTINLGFNVGNRYLSIASDADDFTAFVIGKDGKKSVTIYPRSLSSGDGTWGNFYLLVY